MNYILTHSVRVPPLGRRGQERARTVVFIAPPGNVPESFKQAAEDVFPWAVVKEVGHVDEAVRIFPDTVTLLLVHPDFVPEAERSASDLFRYHPMAMIAALDDGRFTEQDLGARLLCSSLVRSVLPINARQDIALAILGLLLQGIEYFPRALLGAALPRMRPALPEPEPEAVPAADPRLSILTKRELQVLELVQMGLQNKSIANDLGLSGHTVKIHLHNIITKLGARNRTEAAAIYRNTPPPAPAAEYSH
ncbi:MAG: helix-turn-helix transcriptional regulator [Devosia sp.]